MSQYVRIGRCTVNGSEQSAVGFKINGLGRAEQVKLIAKLAKTQPQLAEALTKLDWGKLTARVAKSTLEEMAKSQRLTFRQDFSRTCAGPTDGELIGVLVSGEMELGLVQKPDGSIESDERGRCYSENVAWNQNVLKKLRQSFEEAYRVQAMKTVFELLGCGQVKQVDGNRGQKILVGVRT